VTAEAIGSEQIGHSAPRTRPLSLTILGRYLAIGGPVTLIGLLSAALVPASLDMYRTMGVSMGLVFANGAFSAAVQTLAGVGILRGERWGRLTFLVGFALSQIAAVLIQPLSMIGLSLGFGLITYGVLGYLLVRPAANAYFAGTYDLDGTLAARNARLARLRRLQQRPSDVARLFGIVFGIGAGFWAYAVLLVAPFVPLEYGAFVVLILGGFSLVCVAFAVGLWGPVRWRSVTGWILASAGLFAGLTLLMVVVMIGTGFWTDLMRTSMPNAGDFDPMEIFNLTQIGVGTLVALLVGGAGVLALMAQYARDREALDAPPADTPPPAEIV
jgi:hypothetical protein